MILKNKTNHGRKKSLEKIQSRNNLFCEKFEGESFDEYRRRRKAAKVFSDPKNRKVLVFNSKNAILDKTGKIKAFTKGKFFKGDTSKLKPV